MLGVTFSDIYCECSCLHLCAQHAALPSLNTTVHRCNLAWHASPVHRHLFVSLCLPADYINIAYWSCLLVSVLTGSDFFSQLAHFEVYTAGEGDRGAPNIQRRLGEHDEG